MKRKSRRGFLLLEVMIAFGLLAISSIPLIYPHLMILKEERILIEELNFEMAAKNVIACIIVDLYENAVPFNLIETQGVLEVPKEKLLSGGFPEGTLERAYVTFEQKHKPKEPAAITLYNVDAFLNITYSASTKERFRKEGAKYPFSFNVERVRPHVS